MGLFRLWWVPAGAGAAEGTYVSYDADALLGILALEAVRAGALVVGEDLGTVEDRVRTTLDATGVLGSAVLWFETDDDDAFLPPEQWRPLAMASVTTHDLPTAAGFLAEEQVRVRDELGQLGLPVEQERARVRAERAGAAHHARARGAARRGRRRRRAGDARGPRRLALPVVLAAYGDAVGDLRQPNLPGTVDQYPNWRLPVADGSGRPMSLEELLAAPGVARLATLLDEGVRGGTVGSAPSARDPARAHDNGHTPTPDRSPDPNPTAHRDDPVRTTPTSPRCVPGQRAAYVVLLASPALAADRTGPERGGRPGEGAVRRDDDRRCSCWCPLAIILGIAALVWLPGMVKADRYRPQRGWSADAGVVRRPARPRRGGGDGRGRAERGGVAQVAAGSGEGGGGGEGAPASPPRQQERIEDDLQKIREGERPRHLAACWATSTSTTWGQFRAGAERLHAALGPRSRRGRAASSSPPASAGWRSSPGPGVRRRVPDRVCEPGGPVDDHGLRRRGPRRRHHRGAAADRRQRGPARGAVARPAQKSSDLALRSDGVHGSAAAPALGGGHAAGYSGGHAAGHDEVQSTGTH